jgi:hypothetical protein
MAQPINKLKEGMVFRFMTMIQKTFTIPCTTKSIQDTDSDTLYLTGIANTGLEDLVGDVVTRQALESIAEQIPQHNLHMDHDHDWTGIIGRMTEGWVEEDGVHFKARILRERSNEIRSYLDQDIIMGASISGCCEYEENSVSDIVSWQLTEVSLTPIPCDQATLGSVVVAKSFVDAVRGLQEKIQENEGEKMAEEGTNEQVTLEKVEELINTAFNEKQEDLVETVKSQLAEEYDSKINELNSRIETLEAKQEDDEGGSEETPAVEGEGESPAIGEGEGAAKSDEEEEEEEEPKPDEEEEEDEEDKSIDITAEIQKAVQTEIQKLFQAPQTPSFNYESPNPTDEGNSEKKSYTPGEIADLLTKQY